MRKGDKSMKSDWKKNRKIRILLLAVILLLVIAAGVTAFLVSQNAGKKVQQDLQLPKDRQKTGSDTVTAQGSVSVGTISQTFELDLSEFTGAEDTQFGWQTEMAFPQMNMGGGAGQTENKSGTRQLTVEEVLVKVGEEVQEGDAILKVTQDTLEQIRQELTNDVTEAKTVYDQTVTQEKQTQREAVVAQTENELYGKYADTEYHLSVEELKEAAAGFEKSMEETREELAKAQEELLVLQTTLAEEKTALENAIYSVENEDRLTDPYSWLVAVNAKADLETMIENLETEAEEKETSIETLTTELENLNIQYQEAQKELEKGQIEAESKRQTRQINSENAQEIYDVTTQLAAFASQNAREDYESAQERLSELDSYLDSRIIRAQKSGVITDVAISAGDSLQKDTQLISFNSYDDVTITLTLEEEDMDAAGVGSSAEITFLAYPDKTFKGEVTEIGDARIDSNTNQTTYEVIVTTLENGSGLYEGMSAEVTFHRS